MFGFVIYRLSMKYITIAALSCVREVFLLTQDFIVRHHFRPALPYPHAIRQNRHPLRMEYVRRPYLEKRFMGLLTSSSSSHLRP